MLLFAALYEKTRRAENCKFCNFLFLLSLAIARISDGSGVDDLNPEPFLDVSGVANLIPEPPPEESGVENLNPETPKASPRSHLMAPGISNGALVQVRRLLFMKMNVSPA